LSVPDLYLWLSGIPGAGKTVLAGTIIEETLRKNSESVATTFFFCDYKDTITQSPQNILCVLASQLAIQHEEAYGLLERYHQMLHPKRGLQQSPRVVDLQKLLQDMMKCFDHVYLIVDGLDECGASAGKVIDALLYIINASGNISAAFLSRDEDHIRNRLEEDFENVEIAAHTEDIMEYVTSEVEKRIGEKRLRFNDLTLKGEILDRLVDGAKGM
jgi:Cdc6-like AAA superfamily ATPase